VSVPLVLVPNPAAVLAALLVVVPSPRAGGQVVGSTWQASPVSGRSLQMGTPRTSEHYATVDQPEHLQVAYVTRCGIYVVLPGLVVDSSAVQVFSVASCRIHCVLQRCKRRLGTRNGRFRSADC